jgi:ABC-2 type transport system permease protein
VKPHAPDVRPSAWAESTLAGPRRWLAPILRFIRKTLVIVELETRKLHHDPMELLTRAVQSALWLLVFGEVFTRTHAIPTGSVPYLDFMAPGVLAQSVLFIAIFYGIAVIWERDLGVVHKLLVSPIPRAALVLGKALSGTLVGVFCLSMSMVGAPETPAR